MFGFLTRNHDEICSLRREIWKNEADIKNVRHIVEEKVKYLLNENEQLRASRDEHKRACYEQAYGPSRLWVGSGQEQFIHQCSLIDPREFSNAYEEKVKKEKYTQRIQSMNTKTQLQSTIDKLRADLDAAQAQLKELDAKPVLADCVARPNEFPEIHQTYLYSNNMPETRRLHANAINGTFVPDAIATRATLEALPALLKAGERARRGYWPGLFTEDEKKTLIHLFP